MNTASDEILDYLDYVQDDFEDEIPFNYMDLTIRRTVEDLERGKGRPKSHWITIYDALMHFLSSTYNKKLERASDIAKAEIKMLR